MKTVLSKLYTKANHWYCIHLLLLKANHHWQDVKITKFYPGQSHPTDASNFSDDTFHVKVAISIFYSHGKTVYFFWLTAACNVFSIAGSHPSFMKSSPVIAWQYLQVFKFSQSFTDGNVMDLLLYATFQEVIFLSSFCAFWISRSSSTAQSKPLHLSLYSAPTFHIPPPRAPHQPLKCAVNV